MARRFLLDTNILRKFACGDLGSEWKRAQKLRGAAGRPIFYSSDLVVHELTSHVRQEEASSFSQIRAALEVLDLLVGNEGLFDRQDEILRRTLFLDYPRNGEEEVVALNRLRRRLLKASSYFEVTEEDQKACAAGAKLLDDERAAWVRQMESLKTKLLGTKEDPASGLRGSDCDTVVRNVRDRMLDAFAKHAIDNGPAYGGGRSRADIESALREYIYFEAALLLKAMNKGSYNFQKHWNDHYDQMLCCYPAIGCWVVTDDNRLRKMLIDVGCPNPRVLTIREALSELETAGGGEATG